MDQSASESKETTNQLKNALTGRRVMVTGGLGFIGSNLARRLVYFGADIVLVDSLLPEYGGNRHNIAGIEDQVRVHISDIRDEESMSDLVQRQDYLMNLAGQTSHSDSMRSPLVDLDINCRAQLSLLEACRKFNPGIKIVFANTRQVYGKPSYLPVDENHPVNCPDINAVNKMAAEGYHVLYNNVYGIRTCSLRLTNTYGPGMRIKDARQMFLGIWIKNLLEHKSVALYGDGTQVRDFNYVDDVVEALLLTATRDEADGQIFNLGANDPISLLDLAKLMVEVNGGGEYRLVPFPDERKAIDIGDYHGDYNKIRTTLGWSPKVSLREGLARTLSYYRDHRDKYI